MPTLFLDLETFSETPITHGTHAYAANADILLVAYAWDDEAVQVADLTDTAFDIAALVSRASKIVIHNSAFDRTVLRHNGVDLPIDKLHDTMVQAMAHSLPGSLGQLCDVMGVAVDKAKDKDGKKLIQLFTKPLGKNRILDRADRNTHPEQWAAFIEYARLDVEAMRELYKKLPTWNYRDTEIVLWQLDQVINDRGIAVDLDLARAALRASDRAYKTLAQRANILTEGQVPSLTQRGKLLEYLEREHDFVPLDMTKGTVSTHLKNDLITPQVRELLDIRRQASATSPAKYKVLLNGTSSDGRLRGTLQFCGATRTGRWGGRLFQPQNLPRPTLKNDVIEAGIAAMKANAEDLVSDNVMELCTSAIRGCLIASEGHKLVIADLSNIEGRVLAWLAGETWKVKAFADFDKGVGYDLYVLAYSRSFNVTPEAVLENKKSGDGMMRQIGKVQELALGYQGSIGAFSVMAGAYGIDLPENEILGIVKAWRKAHPAIVRFWYDMDAAVHRAIREGGLGATFHVRGISVRRDKAWLRIRLPSGRYLCYPNPYIDDDKIHYSGTNQYTRKWEPLQTYGGKLVENIVQAVSRDVFAYGMRAAEAAGYKVCLHVHDELITETPDSVEYNHEGLAGIMASGPQWALGLPLAAAGFTTQRYRKD